VILLVTRWRILDLSQKSF